jgi:hypothetical protein
MKRRGQWRRRVAPLPLRVLYTLAELAAASSLSRARLVRLFDQVGIRTVRSGSLILVPLSELEEKAWPFWESIQTAEMLRHRFNGR